MNTAKIKPVALFIHGMLYDTEHKPDHCILSSIADTIKDEFTIIFPKLSKTDSSGELHEVTLEDRSSMLTDSLKGIPIFQPVTVITHSVGALAAVHFIETTNTPVTSALFIAPPSPDYSIAAQTNDCLSNLMPVSFRDDINNVTGYQTRENKTISIPDEVIDSLNTVQDSFAKICKTKGNIYHFFIPNKDRAFGLTLESSRHGSILNKTELSDSHSIKQQSSLNAIIKYIHANSRG